MRRDRVARQVMDRRTRWRLGIVILPAAIGAQRIAALLTRPRSVALAEMVTHHAGLDLEMAEITLPVDSPLVGATLDERDIRRETGAIAVAVKGTTGSLVFPILGERTFEAVDVLIVIGQSAHLDGLREGFGLAGDPSS